MRKIVFLIALAISVMASAQIMEVQSMYKLNTPSNSDLKVAGIAPDGSYILLTSSSNQGLQKYDLSTEELTTISTAAGSGYNVQISEDGNNVVYRETSFDKNHLRHSTLLQQSLVNKKIATLVKASRELEGFIIKGNTVYAVNQKKVQAKSLANAQATAPQTVVSIKDQQLMITIGEESKVLSPNGTNNSYIWPSISPDGTKVCYYVCGDGCYVSNIDGSNVQRIGIIRAAKWYNNSTLIGMQDYDNGEVVTASYIVAANMQGYIQRLTDDRMIAMYPYAVDGTIVFATVQGETYLMNVK